MRGYNINNQSNNVGGNPTGRQYRPVRVTEVLLEGIPAYKNSKGIGVIKYQHIGVSNTNEDSQKDLHAYPGNPNIKQYPLVNEIVFVYTGPGNLTSSIKDGTPEYYYDTPLNLYNSTNHNGAPKLNSKGEKLGGVKEKTVNPLQPYPGDFILEGRLGQSIRFTGNNSELNKYSSEENNTEPLTIITNGQGDSKRDTPYTENIDKDPSSIYLTSNHKVELTPAREKRDAFKEAPKTAKTYKGNQVVINAGRLFFNAKEEDLLLTAKSNIGLTSNIVGIDAKDYIALDANKIYLGEKALKEEFEPVILGESMEGFLYTLLFNLQMLATDLQSAITVSGDTLPILMTRGKLLEASVKGLQNQINPGGKSLLKSRKVYTE